MNVFSNILTLKPFSNTKAFINIDRYRNLKIIKADSCYATAFTVRSKYYHSVVKIEGEIKLICTYSGCGKTGGCVPNVANLK